MLPSVEDVRAWIAVPATVLPDDLLDQVIRAEAELQIRACTVPLDPTGEPMLGPDLIQALYRRVGREVASKDLPLGMLGLESEFGPARLSRWDAEIERLEAPNRRIVFG